MKIQALPVLTALLIVLTLAGIQTAAAASSLTLAPAGNGVFVLQGVMENAAAMEITVTYDASLLANPRVEQGSLISGAMIAVNPNVPGTVRLVVIRVTPVQGSGPVATLTFDKKGSSAGKITGLTATLSNINGKPISVTTRVIDSPDAGPIETHDQEGQQQTAAPSPSPPGAYQPVPSVPAGIALLPNPGVVPGGAPETPRPVDKQEQEAPPEQDAAAVKEPPAASTRNDREAAAVPSKKIYAQKSALDRFQDYRGERTLKAYLALLEQDGAIGFRQDPPALIANGKNTVKAVFISAPVKKGAPNVTVYGAQLVSMKQDPDYSNTWIAEIKPEKDAYRTGLAVVLDAYTMTYPLTVAPARDIDLDRSGKVTEADFALFLQKRGAKDAAVFDVNGDGKRDYLDEYIFTVNYFAAQPKPAAERAGSR